MLMHSSSANISGMVPDREDIAISIAIKYETAYQLSTGIFTFDLGRF